MDVHPNGGGPGAAGDSRITYGGAGVGGEYQGKEATRRLTRGESERAATRR